MRRELAVILFAVCIVVLHQSLAAAHLAGAGNTTSCTGFNRTEDRSVTFWYSSLDNVTAEAANWARTNSIDPTDVNTSGASSSSSADVIVNDANYTTYCGYNWHSTGTTVGLARCTTSHVSGNFQGYCDQHNIYIDTSYFSGTTQFNQRALLAHEIGHTIGAYHETGTTVMVVNLPAPTTALGTHVTNEVNAVFPP